jgi:hypothetical protein
MKNKRRWLGLPVWVADPDGKKRKGTLWWADDASVLIREDGRTGLVALPKGTEGTRWGVAADGMRSDGGR